MNTQLNQERSQGWIRSPRGHKTRYVVECKINVECLVECIPCDQTLNTPSFATSGNPAITKPCKVTTRIETRSVYFHTLGDPGAGVRRGGQVRGRRLAPRLAAAPNTHKHPNSACKSVYVSQTTEFIPTESVYVHLGISFPDHAPVRFRREHLQ